MNPAARPSDLLPDAASGARATAPSAESRRRLPHWRTAVGLAGVLGLAITLAVAPPGPVGDTPATAQLGRSAVLDFGGAEIDEGQALLRNFGTGGDGVLHVAQGDMNGDGFVDLVVGKAGEDAVYLNDGAGGFDTAENVLPFNGADTAEPDHFVLGDLDGDGDLDAIGWHGGTTDRDNAIYLNDGSGDLGNEQPFPGGGTSINDIALADLNGDGALDVLIAREAPGSAQNTIVINANSGTSPPSFGVEQDLGPGHDSTRALATGDVDDDGDIDVLVVNGTNGDAQVSAVFLNDGSGGFFSGVGTCLPSWAWGVPTVGPGSAHSGNKLWGTNLAGDYTNDQDISIVSPTIDLSTAGSSPIQLSAWLWRDSAFGASIDDMDVDVSKDDGATWSSVDQSSQPRAWEQTVIALDASHAVPTFRVRFRLISDETDVETGFYVDDVELTVGGTPIFASDFEADDGGFVATEPAFPTNRVRCLGNAGHDTTSAAMGDMDGDGSLDVVLGNRARRSNPANPASPLIDAEERLFLNDGGGNFTAPFAFGPSFADDRSSHIALGDVDGDGRLDVVVADQSGQDVVLYNDFDLTPGFDVIDTIGPDMSTTKGLALADFDGDGALDVAAGLDQQQSRVFLSTGALAWLDKIDGQLGLVADQSVNNTEAMAAGDIDADGDLDIVVANRPGFSADNRSHLYLNDGAGGFPGGVYEAFDPPVGDARAIAVADLDGDGLLEVLLGFNGDQNRSLSPIFSAGGLSGFEGDCPDHCFGSGSDATFALATGDLDGDGDLDIVQGDNGIDRVHFNDGAGRFPSSTVFGGGETKSAAVGDLDGDGDLDVVLGNADGANMTYLNDSAGDLDGPAAALPFGGAQDTRSVALGDIDGNGTLDIVVGNHVQQNAIYLGDGSGDFDVTPLYFGTGSDATRQVTLGDINGDGALDIALADESGANTIYLSDGASPPRFVRSRTVGHGFDVTTSIVLGDLDGNGSLDVVTGNQPFLFDDGKNPPFPIKIFKREVFLSSLRATERLPARMPAVAIGRPGSTANGQGYSSAEVLDSTMIDVPITLAHPEGIAVGRIEMSYSTDGGDNWRAAVISTTSGLAPIGLTASPGGTDHTLVWDTFASGLFGQSDNVVLRVQAFAQPPVDTSGTYNYIDQSSGPRQWEAASATSFPFRVRGTQVRVWHDPANGIPAANALVYRLPAGHVDGATPFANAAGEPLRTDASGFLRGSGAFGVGDTLYALEPITDTEHYTVYYSSAGVVETGLDGDVVSTPGVVELVTSADNPLMVFNLDVSLEWDARYDEAFMTRLRADIQRASEVLFDVMNGQAIIGDVQIYHAKEEWLAADVIVYAANNVRPAAAMGGVVDDVVDDELADGSLIEDAYVPGQVQMGPSWGRFGDADSDLGEDWPRALAHELGHYYFYQFDNYLGVINGSLGPNDCVGSFMTDAYIDEYSEFLDQDDWVDACLETLAEYTTGRTDWETVLRFYPWLNTTDIGLEGPSAQTLDLTAIEEVDPADELTALRSPFYSLREGGERVLVSAGAAQGYLFKNQDTPELTDDYLVSLGTPVGDQMHARGAEPGDRLCVIDSTEDTGRIGCLTVGASEGTMELESVPGWQPQIEVSPIATDTLAITVTQSSTGQIFAQVMPSTGFSETFPITTTVQELRPLGGDVFAAEVQLAYPMFQAYVRIWEEGSSPPLEAFTEYVLGEGWGPNRRSWGPNRRSWGPNRRSWGPNRRSWGAPVSSADGQVTVYNLDDLFGDTGTSTLQSLSALPPIPSWLEPVGNVQRFESSMSLTRTLAFGYLQQDVPGDDVFESGLGVYHSADDGESWELLDTVLDTADNLATVVMPSASGGDGLYMLAATIEMPALVEGWNQLAYPVAGTRPVDVALASIEEDYRLVYDNGPTSDAPWRLYDQEVLVNAPDLGGLVNDLESMAFGGVYWIYALRDTVPFVGLPELTGGQGSEADELNALEDTEQLPPMTLYGWVTASRSFAPYVGMTIAAVIDGASCGQSTVQSWDGGLAYRLQVDAAGPDRPDCGRTGGTVTLLADGQPLLESQAWDNTRTHHLPLGNVATAAQLEIEQMVLPDPPIAGQPYAYLVTVRNRGPLTAPDVQLTGEMPDNAEPILGAWFDAYCSFVDAPLRCDLGDLPAGQGRTIVLTVRVPIAGAVRSTLRATQPGGGPQNRSGPTSVLDHLVEAAPTPTPTLTPRPSATPTITPTPTATLTPLPSPTWRWGPTPTSTPTPAGTATSTPTPGPTSRWPRWPR